MENTNDVLTSFRPAGQIPLNRKEYSINEATLQDLGLNNNLAYTYHKGLEVICVEERTKWEWKEIEEGDIGLLASNFTYPDGIQVDGIDYSNKEYNFVNIIASSDQNNFVRQILINKDDIEIDDYYDINSIIAYILALPEEERTIAETTSKVNIIIYQAGEGGIQPYEIYEMQNIGKGLIGELVPENFLRFANDELQTFQDVLARSAILTSSHVVSIPTDAKFEMFVEGFGGNFILSNPSLEPDFPNALIGRGFGNLLTENTLSFYSNRTVFKDSVNNRGIEYAGNYEANFTARTLVTKQYVDNVGIQQAITNNPFISEGGTAFEENGYFSLDRGNSAWLSGTFAVGASTDVLVNTPVSMIGMYLPSTDGTNQLQFYRNKTLFLDEINEKGIEYFDDYSANFTDNSLITKKFVETLVKTRVINAGWFSGMNIGTISPLLTGEDINSAVTTSTPGGSNSIILITLANAMPNLNYYVVSLMESLSASLDLDNDSTTPTFRIISTTQFEIGFRELASLTQDLKVHLQVVTYPT